MANPIAITVAQALGLYSASALSGMSFSISHLAVPPMLSAPPPIMVKQWLALYNLGKVWGPQVAIISTASFGYLAYAVESSSLARLYGLAGALVIGIVPFTFIAIVPTNNKLMAKVKKGNDLTDAGLPEDETASALLVKWQRLNYLRALLPVSGALLAIWATLF